MKNDGGCNTTKKRNPDKKTIHILNHSPLAMWKSASTSATPHLSTCNMSPSHSSFPHLILIIPCTTATTTTTMCSTATDSGLSLNPYRRSRTKTRKPKFLSLQQELSAGRAMKQDHQHQLNLFPLHPENLYEEKDMHDNVAYFFDPDGGIAATTLTGLLGAADMSSTSSGEVDFSPPSSYSAVESMNGGSSLERAALRRRRDRDVSEERWVVYSDVATKEKEEEEERWCREWPDRHAPSPGLALKLDYQHILNAWSDKGPLYIEGEGAQIVPDIQAQDSSSVYNMEMAGRCMGNGRLWRVPDEGSSAMEDGGGAGKMGQREAKVLRYREKRQSRLFSKRIRYEVRKLNAEKRPRMKGRFVKRG